MDTLHKIFPSEIEIAKKFVKNIILMVGLLLL